MAQKTGQLCAAILKMLSHLEHLVPMLVQRHLALKRLEAEVFGLGRERAQQPRPARAAGGRVQIGQRRTVSGRSSTRADGFGRRGQPKAEQRRQRKLLERVQAKQHTETVSLAGCTRIDGSGLEPLRGSTVLRTVDLRRAVFRKGLVKATPFDASAFATLESLAASLESLRVLKEDRYPIPTGPLSLARLRECAMCVEVSEAGAEAVTPPKPLSDARRCTLCMQKYCEPCSQAFFRGCIDCEGTFCYQCVYDTSHWQPAYMCVECNGGAET